MKRLLGGLLTASISLMANTAFAATTSALLPISDGAYAQWTPSSGTSHFILVDESSCNGNTDYVSATSAVKKDSYGIDLSSIPDGAAITSVAITPCASKNTSGGSNSTLNVFYRFNGVDSAAAGAYALSGTTPTDQSATTYSGLALSKGASSALEIGAIFQSGAKGARLSRISTVLTYVTAPAAPSDLSAIASSTPGGIDLHWTDNSSDETNFDIWRSTNDLDYRVINTVWTNVAHYSDTATSGVVFYYKVRAYNQAGASSFSNVASTTAP